MCPSDRIAVVPKKLAGSNLRSAFDVIDVDRDGKISRDDLSVFYSGLATGEDPDDVIRTMMAVADSNSDGFVEYDEFEKVVRGHTGEIDVCCGGSLLEDVFKMMDSDGDGRLNHQDLKSFLASAGLNASDDDEIKAMIRLAGGDDKTGASLDGLLKVFGC